MICECCGQPDGACPECGRAHSPAIPGGCEECSPERTPAEGDAVRVRLWNGQHATGRVDGFGEGSTWVEVLEGPEWAKGNRYVYRPEDVELVAPPAPIGPPPERDIDAELEAELAAVEEGATPCPMGGRKMDRLAHRVAADTFECPACAGLFAPASRFPAHTTDGEVVG